MFLVELNFIQLTHFVPLYREGICFHDTQPQMVLEVKPQKGYLLIILKGKKQQIGHSKFIYTYTLRKELSVEFGEGEGKWGVWGN